MKRLFCAIAMFAMVVSGGLLSAADVAEHQWVRASADGNIQGRVVVPRNEGITAARGAKVTLIDQHGKFAADAVESDKTGRFVLSGVNPGVYTLMIQGEDAFACCAMHVVNSSVPISDQFEIAAGAVDFSVVRSAMVRYMPSGEPTNVVFDPSSNPLSGGAQSASVRISQFEGGLRGRLTRPGFSEDQSAKDANVIVYSDGVEVARTVTDATGRFNVAELAPGSYSVLGSGKDGFGLLGLELIDSESIESVNIGTENGQTLVLQPGPVSDSFQMQVAPPVGATVIDDRLISEEDMGAVPLDDTGYAMQGGAGGGGGGGGGGGIGGGRLLLWGGIGAAIALGASNNGDSISVPPPISPADPPVITP